MTMPEQATAHAMRAAIHETVRRHSGWYLVQGILMVIAGILALVYPTVSTFAVTLFLGWLLIIAGIFQAISLISARDAPHFWLPLLSVVLFIVVGALILRNPAGGVLTLTLLMIVFFMVEGITKVIHALTIRPLPNWGWVLVSGIIGILLSIFLWARLPVTAIWLLGVFVGVTLIAEGVATSAMAWRVRRS